MRRTPLHLATLAAALAWACSGGSDVEPKPSTADAAIPKPGVADANRPDPGPPPRLLIFGVDGATWDVAGPLIREGRMPHFARLCGEGTYANLQTTQPNLSPILWTTIATGEPAEVHGIEGFTVPVPGTDEKTLPSSNLRRVPAFWNVLSNAGQTVGLVNWWVSYPAEPIDGFVISDRANFVRKRTYRDLLDLSEDEPANPLREVHPPELYLEIASHVQPSPEIDRALVSRIVDLPDDLFAELQAHDHFDRDHMLSVLKFALLQDESMLAAGLHALGKYEPEVMIFYTSGLDASEHHFWKYHEPEKFRIPVPAEDVTLYSEVIRNYYVYVDDVLGKLLDHYGDEPLDVIVVSDHGHVAFEDYGTTAATGYGKIASGWHGYAPPGIFAASGPSFARLGSLRGPQPTIFDVAPTILAVRDVPPAEDVEGKVIRKVIDPGVLAHRMPGTVPSYRELAPKGDQAPVQSDSDEELLEKLRALGYIE